MTIMFDGTGPLFLRPAETADHGYVLANWGHGGTRQLERFVRQLSGNSAFSWEHVRPALVASIRDAFFDRARRALATGQVQVLAASHDRAEPVGFVAIDAEAASVLYIHLGGDLRKTGVAEELLRHVGVVEGWNFSAVSPVGCRLAQRMGLRWRPEEK